MDYFQTCVRPADLCEDELKRSQSTTSLDGVLESQQSPKPFTRKKIKPPPPPAPSIASKQQQPTPGTAPPTATGEVGEKSNKNREGMIIPPSPSQMNNTTSNFARKELFLHSPTSPPAPPPTSALPPTKTTSLPITTSTTHVPPTKTPSLPQAPPPKPLPPKPPQPTNHNVTSDEPTVTHQPRQHHMRNTSGGGSPSSGSGSGSVGGSNSLHYSASLPRHYTTNKNRASVVGRSEEEEGGGVTTTSPPPIGFDLIHDSMTTVQANRPIPAPRSSLLNQSQQDKPTLKIKPRLDIKKNENEAPPTNTSEGNFNSTFNLTIINYVTFRNPIHTGPKS